MDNGLNFHTEKHYHSDTQRHKQGFSPTLCHSLLLISDVLLRAIQKMIKSLFLA